MVVKPALNVNLMEKIFSSVNVGIVWKQVASNKGKPGVDRMDIASFLKHSRGKWTKIKESLLDGTYIIKS
jgi:retron-type reverse transcriptase